MTGRRTTRGMSSQDRVQTREELVKAPSTVADCMYRLRIIEDSVVYHDLILAIIQFTGYTKQFPNEKGQVEPRGTKKDGSLHKTFQGNFMRIVNEFLNEQKAGIQFFGQFLPDDPEWKASFLDIPGMLRLQWAEHSEDGRDILTNMALLFEALRSDSLPVSSNGEMFDLDKGTLRKSKDKSYDNKDCFICGSSDSDGQIQCHRCESYYHHRCCGIDQIPEGDWVCLRCVNRTEQAEETKKRRKLERQNSESPSAHSRTMGPNNNNEANSDNVLQAPSELSGRQESLGPDVPNFQHNWDNYIVLARLKAYDVYRLVDTGGVYSLEQLFRACGAVWGVEVENFYVYLSDNNGVLELKVEDDKSFHAVFKMLQNAVDIENVVTIRVLILQEGETY